MIGNRLHLIAHNLLYRTNNLLPRIDEIREGAKQKFHLTSHQRLLISPRQTPVDTTKISYNNGFVKIPP